MDIYERYWDKITKIQDANDIITWQLYQVIFIDWAEDSKVQLRDSEIDWNIYVTKPKWKKNV